MKTKMVPPRIFTIGHSTRSIQEFIAVLNEYKLKLVVDVRTIPKSRHNPQFGQERLRKALNKNGIEYVHRTHLGGLLHASKTSKNMGWRNASFRGYADYMQTDEFKKALHRLVARSRRKRLVMMCAEAVPWRCHRSLIADALFAHGIPVEDLFTKTSHQPHRLTRFAKITKGNVTYPTDK
ncbi:DUF488 domain-containing protein [soil metagenome]